MVNEFVTFLGPFSSSPRFRQKYGAAERVGEILRFIRNVEVSILYKLWFCIIVFTGVYT